MDTCLCSVWQWFSLFGSLAGKILAEDSKPIFGNAWDRMQPLCAVGTCHPKGTWVSQFWRGKEGLGKWSSAQPRFLASEPGNTSQSLPSSKDAATDSRQNCRKFCGCEKDSPLARPWLFALFWHLFLHRFSLKAAWSERRGTTSPFLCPSGGGQSNKCPGSSCRSWILWLWQLIWRLKSD